MPKYQITLKVEESSESMAYQALAIAIKKKFKKQIRPFFPEWSDSYVRCCEWQKRAGAPYDY